MIGYSEVKKHLSKKRYNWLVTGAAGFIGSNIVEKLIALNQKVVGLDNFSTGNKKNLKEALDKGMFELSESVISKNKNNFYFIKGDINDKRLCQKVCKKIDFVLHQAALGSVPRSIENPINTNETNIGGFLNILVAAKDNKVKRFVYAASSSSYGDHPGLPKKEEIIGEPLSPYAITKYTNELYAKVFNKHYGLDSIGLRYFNVFGKRQDPSGAYAAVIPKWIISILKQENVYINGDGKTTRDFCYIDNVVQANLLAALINDKDAINQIYNIAVNHETSLNDLYNLIADRVLKIKSNLRKFPPIKRDFRPGDVKHSRADISKARDLLGYIPSHDINKGLDESIDWYLKNLKY